MIVPILPLYARSFGAGLAAIGFVQFAFGVTRFSFGIIGGLVVDRFGERAAAVWGLIIGSAASFAVGFSESFTQLVLARGVAGVGAALFLAGFTNRILRIFEPEEMGRATGLSKASLLIGFGAGPVFGGGIAQHFGNVTVFLIYGGLLLVATALAWVTMVGSPIPGEPQLRRSPLDALRTARPLFSDFRYVMSLAATFAGWWIVAGPAQTIGTIFAREELGFTKSQVGFAFTLLAVGQLLGLLIAGRAADRFDRRVVLVPALALMTLATAAIGQMSDGIWQFYVAMMMVGSGIAASATAAGRLMADALPRGGSGTAVGVNQMAGDLGFLTSPIVLGVVAEETSFPSAYFLAAIPSAAVLLCSLRLPSRRDEQAAA